MQAPAAWRVDTESGVGRGRLDLKDFRLGADHSQRVQTFQWKHDQATIGEGFRYVLCLQTLAKWSRARTFGLLSITLWVSESGRSCARRTL